ncbi:50S ribosomal protein L6 [Candidatus Falkowbacteria bacterium CG10_big_fil_rev_8_21_14_0_10_43_11]|uniref:Large ribosomal subunit protein uL6 n=1 Tax=Candidatus Falkowbacteria bacterium CG10_big_fil_rev_8_21_14_0_10_43_11 TaxID=1974568 RepID=A0A2M6WLN1_9BACT|nr:MAG: 50S ribosomal protein L6 [Candidatus Falkowbacteria bacterium CG10_big_fil_rev_8_21_14_0_10_43_11]
MSRIGKLPIKIMPGTEAKLQDNVIIIKGPKGELKQTIHAAVNVDINEGKDGKKEINISVKNESDKKNRALWGLYRVLIDNMVEGVNKGYAKQLEINGVGYRAAAVGNKLTLNLGFSHPVDFSLPAGITATVEKNVITVSGIDKQLVGEVSAQIRRIRKPEPYKGKGIKYATEILRRKAGKTAASTAK